VTRIQNYQDKLNNILNDPTVSGIVKEVEALYEGKSIVIHIDEELDSHGGVHWQEKEPTISINPKTGITRANICHELIHAIQLKSGFPFIRSNIYKDKRSKVLMELISNLLHINLVSEFNKRGIDVSDYLSPTINQIKVGLKKRKKKEVKTIPLLRIHYDSLVFLRIFYEAKYLPLQEKEYIKLLFKKFSPTAYELTFELVEIIEKRNPVEPNGCFQALLDCLNHLNGENATRNRFDFIENHYIDSTNELKASFQAYKKV
jgi:hypothetical protein